MKFSMVSALLASASIASAVAIPAPITDANINERVRKPLTSQEYENNWPKFVDRAMEYVFDRLKQTR